jgi:hypothetical protein
VSGNLLWLGYPSAVSNKLTTELNSLADGSVCALSAEIDNSSNLHRFADFQLDLASLTISSTSAYAHVFIVPTVDGTNYPDWTSGAYAAYHGQYYVGAINLKNVSATTARADLREISLPPGKFKVALRNGVGASLAASGNTLGMRSYSESYT